MKQIAVALQIVSDPIAVIDALWSGAEWASRWSPIVRFSIQYDDRAHQVADLTLDWNGTAIDMTLIRFRTAPTRIDFFCPVPPPPLQKQTGSWAIESRDGTHALIARRQIALMRQDGESGLEYADRSDRYAATLSGRLSRILAQFKRAGEAA